MSEKRPGIDRVVEWLKQQDKPVVVDIGAHTGKTTQMWLTAGAKVYAVEPSYENIVQLALSFNNLRCVELCLLAIGAEPGVRPLYVPKKKGKDRSQGATMFRRTLKEKKRVGEIDGYKKEKVDVLTLKGFVKRYGIKQIDLLKVNCEGAEYEVLQAEFPCPIRAVFVSWHKDHSLEHPSYASAYFSAKGRFLDNGLELVSNESRGDHTWEFWRKP